MLCEDGKKMYITGTVFVKGAVPMVHCILSPNYCVCFAMWAVASLCNVSSRVTLQCEHSRHFAMWAVASLCNVSTRVTLQCEHSRHFAMWAVASLCNVSSHVTLQCQQSRRFAMWAVTSLCNVSSHITHNRRLNYFIFSISTWLCPVALSF